MRWWAVSPAELEAADAEPWEGPLASAGRPLSTMSIVRVSLSGAALYSVTTLGGIALALLAADHVRSMELWIAFLVLTQVFALGVITYLLVIPARVVRRTGTMFALIMLTMTPFAASVGVAGAGPDLSLATAAYVQGPVFAVYLFTRRWAIFQASLNLVGFGFVVVLQTGWPSGVWLWVAAGIAGSSLIIGQIVARIEELAAAEHRARVELAELNVTLEDEVASQVAEIERLGRLRRFLSPQIADVVISGSAATLEQPHRRRIAVFFCDLRGFTAFTNNAEPEEVIAVLGEYYEVVGSLLRRFDATVGDYAGDGIMAYFGDPVPREDSAVAAVEMSAAVVDALEPLVEDWRRRGYDLHFGIGLAYGYSTLGVIGFDGRYDYKPVGAVVNLAARLCGRAGAGQVLLDHPTFAETSARFPSESVADLDLKGFGAATRVYVLQRS